jgi:hypothetical protein
MTENQKPAFAGPEAGSENQPSSKPYAAPVLRVYGTVGKLTQAGGTLGAEGQSGKGSYSGSDPVLKESVVRVGTHPLGFGLYLFDYKPPYRDAWGHGRQFGVMADEVEAVMPEAISVAADGYRMVDYRMLAITRPALNA